MKPSRTRIVKYDYEADFDESVMEQVLQRAKRAGTVTEFDTGRGHIVWFEGPPGASLRDVRRRVREILEAYAEAPYRPTHRRALA